MRILVWQWGRRGAGPLYAVALADAFGETALLSLSTTAELLQTANPPPCALPVQTYASVAGLLGRLLAAPITIPRLARWLRRNRVDIALCAMPAATDLIMVAALRLARIPYAVVIHDAALHPGDRFPLQIRLQRWTMRSAAAVFALSQHVADHLPPLPQGVTLLRSTLPPFEFGTNLPPPRAHGGAWQLLSFGRLLPYKGLDLLADALTQLGHRSDVELRIVGSGPASRELDRLSAMPNVIVENRWVPEAELSALLGWADAVILPYREASQSGIAAAAITAGRYVVATNVGGLAEQLAGIPGTTLCAPDPASLAEALTALLNGDIAPPVAGPKTWPATAQKLQTDLRTLSRWREKAG